MFDYILNIFNKSGYNDFNIIHIYIAITLLDDNMRLLNELKIDQFNLVKILLFIPWLLFNGILNFCLIGRVVNLFITFLIFSNASICIPVSKNKEHVILYKL